MSWFCGPKPGFLKPPSNPSSSLLGPDVGGMNHSEGHMPAVVSGHFIFACTYHPVEGRVNLPMVLTMPLVHG